MNNIIENVLNTKYSEFEKEVKSIIMKKLDEDKEISDIVNAINLCDEYSKKYTKIHDELTQKLNKLKESEDKKEEMKDKDSEKTEDSKDSKDSEKSKDTEEKDPKKCKDKKDCEDSDKKEDKDSEKSENEEDKSNKKDKE